MKPYIAVISSGRPENVPAMVQLVNHEHHWYVGEGEIATYGQHSIHVIESGGLIASRNRALEDAFEKGCYCVQVSDDLKGMQSANDGTWHKLIFMDAVHELYGGLMRTPFRLAGIAPTDNKFYYNEARPFTYAGFCVGDLIVVKATHLRFDPMLRLKEDYDYTLQHLKTYGGIFRHNGILASFQHRTNAGGTVSYRNNKLEQEAINYLKKKWIGLIRDNAKRPHEILLNLPKRTNPVAEK